MRGLRRREVALTGTLVLAVLGLFALQVAKPWADERPAPERPWPVPAARTAEPRLQLGVTTLALARNADRPWGTADLAQVNTFEQDARHHAGLVMWFADWAHTSHFDAAQAAAVAARGSVPEITWEPWDATGGTRQPAYRLERLIDGDHDGYVRRWAREIAAYGRPVRLRFAHEMNAHAYPWAEAVNGNRPGQFVRAWRRVHAIFAQAGASNVQWVWSPVAGAVRADLYPGSDQVDVIGVSGFNGGSVLFGRRWRTFADAFGSALDGLHALAPGKPVELAEIASAEAGGSKAAWIRGLFAEIRRRPYVRSLVWFNLRKETDWRIESSGAARRAFAAGINATSR
jgi:beta-mannanase